LAIIYAVPSKRSGLHSKLVEPDVASHPPHRNKKGRADSYAQPFGYGGEGGVTRPAASPFVPQSLRSCVLRCFRSLSNPTWLLTHPTEIKKAVQIHMHSLLDMAERVGLLGLRPLPSGRSRFAPAFCAAFAACRTRCSFSPTPQK
jgi:hypothetical protein